MHLSEIYRYPLKSGAAEPLESAEMRLPGISFDRHWMVVTESGRYITQREKGAQKLALIKCVVGDHSVEFIAPDSPPLSIPLSRREERHISVELFDKTLLGADAGDEAARWISDYLPMWRGEKFRLIHFPSNYTRDTRGHYTQLETAQTEFADGYAALITNRASLEELNRRLGDAGVDPVLMSVFRPNLVIDGADAWAEDNLRQIQIGEVVLEVVKPCARCPITGVNQESGMFSQKPLEPRKTLSSFHAGRHLIQQFPELTDDLLDSPMFGQNAVVVRGGTIQRNDRIAIISKR